ncbi:MAG: UDP-2,4-diacetamido-2,4,6-trideoxy-beta-L-altropyranose hydrolase [Pseudomonadota bacterium]
MTDPGERRWIGFRVDASYRIGGGHVMRCLTLADALKRRGYRCLFLCRELEGAQIERVKRAGHEVRTLCRPGGDWLRSVDDPPHADWLEVDWRADADECVWLLESAPPLAWLIVDHYAIDRRWMRVVAPCTERVAVIDDLDDRPLEGDLLVNQSAFDDRLTQPGPSHALVGPRYAILRPEFAELREASLARRGSLPSARRILVSTGLMDIGGGALKAAKALTGGPYEVDLAVSSSAETADALREIQAPNLSVHFDCDEVGKLMAEADLAIGAAGATSWERLTMGLPSLVFTLAANQRDIAAGLADAGAAISLGRPEAINENQIRAAVLELCKKPETLVEMSRCASEMCDGLGVDRVIQKMNVPAQVASLSSNAAIKLRGKRRLRALKPSDKSLLLGWRNQEPVRLASLNQAPISFEDHQKWFDGVRKRDDGIWTIYEVEQIAIGHISATLQSNKRNTWRWNFYIGEQNARRREGMGMCFLMLDYLFSSASAETVEGVALRANPKSLGVHDRFGFQRLGPIEAHQGTGSPPADIYALDRDAWFLRRKSVSVHLQKHLKDWEDEIA